VAAPAAIRPDQVNSHRNMAKSPEGKLLVSAIAKLAAAAILSITGCDGKPSKADVEKRVRDGLSAASADWKDIQYETRTNDTVSVVLASRVVNGKT
jgi:hypothetical protein